MLSVRRMLETLPARLRLGLRSVEDWHFDTRNRVHTAGDPTPHRATDIVGAQRDGYVYAPARVRNVEAALDALALDDPRSCTFIDIGSGKGRVVILAAKRAFRRVIGVEYSDSLHRAAEENVRRFSKTKRARAPIDLVLADAATYVFPQGNLVLHLFNPFGPEVMGRMLQNLEAAIRQQPARVFIILLWPELSHMVAGVPGARLYRSNRRFEIFVVENA